MVVGIGGFGAQHGTVEVVCAAASGQRWALPLAVVERVVPMVAVTPLPDSPIGVRGAINVHGEVVPVLDLDVRLGRPAREHGPSERLLLARTSRRRVALPVDEVEGVVTVPAIAPAPATTPAPVAGTAALPDGLLVIYDVDAFLTPEDDDAVAAALAGAGN